MRTYISNIAIIFMFTIGGLITIVLGTVGLAARIVRFISSTIQSAMSVSIAFVVDRICKLVDKVSV